jgi:cystathionine gamma-lyase
MLEVKAMDLDQQELILMHDFEDRARHYGAVAPPVYLNSLHVFPTFEEYAHVDPLGDECYVYGRAGNPTTHLLERKLAALEGGAMAAVFSSGMAAATSAILGTCKSGDHIVCMRDAYQPVKRFMAAVGGPRLGIDISFVSGTDLEEVERAIRPNTRLMILESPATFVFTVVDLKAISEICKRHGVVSYIDNTYCTPLGQNPLEFGIDIVMHTLSKYLGGHSDVIGGALIARDADLMTFIVKNMREWLGGVLGPMEGWLVLRGMRTLEARLLCHQESALKVASWLEGQPKVRRVLYTGLDSHPQRELIRRQMRLSTGLMSLELDRPPADAVRFINGLKLFGKGCSWGGFESLALCPLYEASDEEIQFLGNPDRGLIRLHVGLEGADNLVRDLGRSLDTI